MVVKLWVDDIRKPPDNDWHWAKSYFGAISALIHMPISFASLDHDLGEGNGKEGYDIVLWMAEHNIWPLSGISVHSMNPVGKERMLGVIKRYGPYNR